MAVSGDSGPDVPDPDKRKTLKRIGLAAGTVATASHLAPRYSPVGRAEAIGPLVVLGGAALVGGGAGYLLGEWDPLESDSPPEGATASGLEDSVYNTSETRLSTTKSTFVDQENLIKMGFPETLYGDGKLAGIESLNNEQTESAVEQAAHEGAVDHATTVMKNFLKSWKEAVNELEAQISALNEHPDSDAESVYGVSTTSNSDPTVQLSKMTFVTKTVDLPDGSTFDIPRIEIEDGSFATYAIWDPIERSQTDNTNGSTYETQVYVTGPGDQFTYLSFENWNNIYSAFETALSDVKSGLSTWVTNVYGEVQSGELDTSELLTPSELANMSADEGTFNQAVADLMALNIKMDLEREAEIHLEETNATLYGSLAVTSEPEGGVPAGEVYDPELYGNDFYFTYDISQGNGTWTEYAEGIDGGQVTLTEEPHPNTLYQVQTGHNETAEVTAEDFNQTDGGNYTADISGQLSSSISSVSSINFYAETEETQFETVRLNQPFEVVTYTDSDGNEHDNADFSQDEPQDDTNYITEEEWKAREERMDELIDKYEEAKNDDGGPWIPWDGEGGFLNWLMSLSIFGIPVWIPAVGYAGFNVYDRVSGD